MICQRNLCIIIIIFIIFMMFHEKLKFCFVDDVKNPENREKWGWKKDICRVVLEDTNKKGEEEDVRGKKNRDHCE